MKTDKPKATIFLFEPVGQPAIAQRITHFQLYSSSLRFARIVLALVCLSRTVAGRTTAKKAQMSLMLDGEKRATSKYFNCFTLAGSKRLKNGISYQQPQPQSMSICFTLSVSERAYAQPNFTLTKSIVLFQCCHFYFSLRLYNFKIILYIFDLFYFSQTSQMICQQFTGKKEGNSNCSLGWAVIRSKGWIKFCSD